ncbi:hypothetical protein DFJ58DRAFT_660990 [Suillus subalutaceus]|uniref:uncharacterized protein n=1 Tax=Suillus subalutaceus TaxID=48586 RepID=UPI001B8766AB|nr:uncharacterized protein DFJ58DRAFT_660990 [Suillus subalutaceus]KAG1852846.1 hypothetical protein DFJ58DRAFT_660990 [Suillus subalutaceus]
MWGSHRGSYIWGRSVHNIRIERLWVDWTSGVGSKWKTFFQNLEVHDGLDPELPSHIWLLHHLFLNIINTEGLQWANSWNAHTMTLPGQRNDSPHALRFFSIISGGGRGIDAHGNVLPHFQPIVDDLTPEEIDEYGIDWEAYDDHHIRHHNVEENPPDHLQNNPFIAHWPEQHNIVEVEVPGCPLNVQQLAFLDNYTQGLPVETMNERHALWVVALGICQGSFQWAM